MRIFFISILTILLSLNCYSQPRLVDGQFKAKDITQTGFSISFTTDLPTAYKAKFIPLKNVTDTIFVENLDRPNTEHEIKISGLQASSFYKAEIKVFDDSQDTLVVRKSYATSSLSTGEIKAYFNHEINQDVANSPNNVAHFVNNAMRDTLINYIERAEESIDIAIYNSFGNNPTTDLAGAINQAYQNGVQVRVIHEGSTSSTMISVLNSNIPIIQRMETGNFSGIMHHKFIVIDAEHQDPSKSIVWTGSTNWTTGQINGPDKNNVIILQDQTLAQTYKMEFDEMWGSSGTHPDFQNIKFGSDKEDNTPKEFNIGGIDVECYFSPTDGTQQQILNLIEVAQESIVVATMLITRQSLAQALIDQYNDGISEFGFVIDTEDYNGQQKELLENNLSSDVYFEYTANGIMHHKMMVIDHGTPQAAVLTGSHNWSFSAENRNDENTLIIFDEDIANQYYQAVSQLFKDVGQTLNNEDFEAVKFKFYPNPVKHKLYIAMDTEVTKIEFFDVLGRKVKSESNLSNLEINGIDVEQLRSGAYFVKLTTSKGIQNFKIIKE